MAEGQVYLFFGGTAYLGLNTHVPFIELFKEGVDRFGINNGSSRVNNVQLGVYAEAERAAASRFGAADALVLSSGFLAGQLAVRHLASQFDEVCYAPHSHPALWLQDEPRVSGDDFALWQDQLVKYINRSNGSSFLVVSSTLDVLRPERYDFSAFARLWTGKRVHLLLDDSHGIGILDSENLRQPLQDGGVRVTVVASLAKGLGVDAGVILGDAEAIDSLRLSPAFRGASPPSPAGMHAFIYGEDIYRQRRAQLRSNIALFAQGIAGRGLQFISDFPVFYSADQTLYSRLAEKGVLISSFPYPSPSAPLYNRIVISAAHTAEDIRTLYAVLPNTSHEL